MVGVQKEPETLMVERRKLVWGMMTKLLLGYVESLVGKRVQLGSMPG